MGCEADGLAEGTSPGFEFSAVVGLPIFVAVGGPTTSRFKMMAILKGEREKTKADGYAKKSQISGKQQRSAPLVVNSIANEVNDANYGLRLQFIAFHQNVQLSGEHGLDKVNAIRNNKPLGKQNC